MEPMLIQVKNLGTLVSSEQELKEAGFNEGKKVLSIISTSCFYCKALMNSWEENEKQIKNYLSENNIGLLFIEKWNSIELAREWGDGGYPNVHCYKDGKQSSGKFVELYASNFINWLNWNF
jgi:hypothetical protein